MIYAVMRISTGLAEYIGPVLHHAAFHLTPGRTFGRGETNEDAKQDAGAKRCRHVFEGYKEPE